MTGFAPGASVCLKIVPFLKRVLEAYERLLPPALRTHYKNQGFQTCCDGFQIAPLGRDLPSKFVRHCIEEYGASLVCFILPSRYAKLGSSGSKDDGLLPRNEYELVIHELPSSTFYFQGYTKVTQPSVLCCIEEKGIG